MTVNDFKASSWQEIDQRTFDGIWTQEVDAAPKTIETTFGLVTGLITPLWSLLEHERPTVYRLTDDNGVSHIGRHIEPALIPGLMKACHLDHAAPALSPNDAATAIARGERVPLAGGQGLDTFIATARVMDRERIEIRNAPAAWLDGLKACGCFIEVIQWRTRVFVPAYDDAVLDRVLRRFGPDSLANAA